MIVVSNSSPIISLATIGLLDLLQKLYGDVHLPDAVYNEIVLQGTGRPGASEVQTQPWFQRHRVTDTGLVALLRQDLGEGEAEAIALALELKADLVLIDDLAARGAAAPLGVRFTGSMGVLLEARAAGTSRQSDRCWTI
jgi:hypothetical protein